MDPGFQLVSLSMGSLFSVPESSWTQISKRVGLAILTKDIADAVAQYLPDFPALVAASQVWKDETFPDMVAKSKALSDYCLEAVRGFEGVRKDIAGLDPNKPLPDPIRRQAQAVFDALDRSTSALNVAFTHLAERIMTFTTLNNVVDAKILSYRKRLGDQWAELTKDTQAVDDAVGLVLGVWSAITDDLNAVATGKISITTSFLLGLDIEFAIRSWNDLKEQTKAFAGMANGQSDYLTGRWLTGA
jgi:hypothetical protein